MPKAAIVYLIYSSTEILKQSLQSLQRCFLGLFPNYPVIIFYEALTDEDKQQLQALIKSPIYFVYLEDFLKLPSYDGLSEEQAQRWVAGLDGGRKTHLGYIQMCRFFAYQIYHHPVLKDFDYYWRFDDDSILMQAVSYDPFVQMQDNGWVYGYRSIEYENPKEIIGLKELWLTTQQFARQQGLSLRFAKKLVCNRLGRYTGMNYYNNFEINQLSFWRNLSLHTAFVQYLDHALGFYRYRWGDANVRTLAIGLFLKKSQVHHFKEIAYRHNDHYALPGSEKIIYTLDQDVIENQILSSQI